MKAIEPNVYKRGQTDVWYVRRRIPASLRSAYPSKKTHIVRSLGTSDPREARVRARAELVRIDDEFRQKRERLDLGRASLAAKRVERLDDSQLEVVGKYWLRQILQNDEERRSQGLDDEDFAELGAQLEQQRVELGRMLAQGNSLPVYPALHNFLYLCGVDFQPNREDALRASGVFLRAIIRTLDHQLARQRGEVVPTDEVLPCADHPLHVVAPERAPDKPGRPSWEKVFEVWRDHVENRPVPTTIASQTAWRDLRRFAGLAGVRSPGEVTAEMMTAFARDMRERNLAVVTLNERLSKIRAIYKIAVGRHLLPVNPAANTLGYKESSVTRRRKRRMPFDLADLQAIFGSAVFTEHKRSKGQSGEASYWIPLLMFYTGARPEELAGLALSDVVHDPKLGWYLRIVDRPCDEDLDLFEDDVPESHRRTLKNAMSIRRVPLAQELIDLGLLRYIEWLRARKEAVLFPMLKKDFHGKLSGAFSKFFGRYKKHVVGITDKRKVLYSFRHCMKDMLEAAGVPTKYLQRMLGHTTGDGNVTDGYGSDLPFNLLVKHFKRVKFAAIPAKPWEPGRGSVSLKNRD